MSKDRDQPSIEEVFIEYLGVDRDRADMLADWFASSAWGNPTNFLQPSEDIRVLSELREACCSIMRFHDEANQGVIDLLRSAIYERDLSENTDVHTGNVSNWNPRHLPAWNAARESACTWKSAIDEAIRKAEASPLKVRSRSRLNAEAVNIVDRARLIWETETGSPAPAKGLNIATKFGRYLADLFLACDCEADPRSAFNAWAKHLSAYRHSERGNI